jgi:hypothetical protein
MIGSDRIARLRAPSEATTRRRQSTRGSSWDRSSSIAALGEHADRVESRAVVGGGDLEGERQVVEREDLGAAEVADLGCGRPIAARVDHRDLADLDRAAGLPVVDPRREDVIALVDHPRVPARCAAPRVQLAGDLDALAAADRSRAQATGDDLEVGIADHVVDGDHAVDVGLEPEKLHLGQTVVGVGLALGGGKVTEHRPPL